MMPWQSSREPSASMSPPRSRFLRPETPDSAVVVRFLGYGGLRDGVMTAQGNGRGSTNRYVERGRLLLIRVHHDIITQAVLLAVP